MENERIEREKEWVANEVKSFDYYIDDLDETFNGIDTFFGYVEYYSADALKDNVEFINNSFTDRSRDLEITIKNVNEYDSEMAETLSAKYAKYKQKTEQYMRKLKQFVSNLG